MIRYAAIYAAGVLLSGVAAAKPAVLEGDNGRLRVELLDPVGKPDHRDTGCRFIRAGWIAALYPAGMERSIFQPRGWHHRPMFGFAFECFPQLKLNTPPGEKRSRLLQVGVGVVAVGSDRFDAVPVKFFGWERSWRKKDGTAELFARQSSGKHDGYAYEMSVRVVLPENADSIRYEITLCNTGERSIETELYAHPFFNASPGFAECWFSLPGRPEREAVKTAPASLEVSGSGLPGTAAGGFAERDIMVRLCGTPEFDRVEFWKNASDCYAVEPFWRIVLKPGERQTRTCFLTVRRENA